MKIAALIICFFSLNTFCQNKGADYWLDQNGNVVEKNNRMSLAVSFPDNSVGFRKTIDSGMVYQYNVPKYSTYKVDYKIVKKEIEKITKKTFNDSTIFLLSFQYFNDPCSYVYSNNMTKQLIYSRKGFLNSIKSQLEKKHINVVFIELFDNRIKLKNNINAKKEYFFSDSNSFFRLNLFTYSTVCGSLGLIKPNGETLIRNGEYRPDSMADHLDNDVWNTIFQQ